MISIHLAMKTFCKALYTILGTFVLFLSASDYQKMAAQNTESAYSKESSLREWDYSPRAPYEQMKQTFLHVYGSDTSGWPLFIKEAIRLDNLYKDYEKVNGKPGYNLFPQFFKERDSCVKDNPGIKPYQYRQFHDSQMRNYFSIFNYRYPDTEDDGTIKPSSKWVRYETDGYTDFSGDSEYATKTYLSAVKTDGILPPVLYQFAFHCPPGMLEWCFKEVFPALDWTCYLWMDK